VVVIGANLAQSLATRGVADIAVVDLALAGVYASSELFEDPEPLVREGLHI
jgi:hypothetical protein